MFDYFIVNCFYLVRFWCLVFITRFIYYTLLHLFIYYTYYTYYTVVVPAEDKGKEFFTDDGITVPSVSLQLRKLLFQTSGKVLKFFQTQLCNPGFGELHVHRNFWIN